MDCILKFKSKFKKIDLRFKICLHLSFENFKLISNIISNNELMNKFQKTRGFIQRICLIEVPENLFF